MKDLIENWRVLPSREKFEVSDLGKVRTITKRIVMKNGRTMTKKGRILKEKKNKKGYPEIRLYEKRNISITQTVHKLVMLTFVGLRPEGLQVNHKNGIKTDNRLVNLEYVTPSDNIKHAYRLGLQSRKGERNNHAKLKVGQVQEIREKYSTGNYTQKSLGLVYGVCQDQISSIVRRESWN